MQKVAPKPNSFLDTEPKDFSANLTLERKCDKCASFPTCLIWRKNSEMLKEQFTEALMPFSEKDLAKICVFFGSKSTIDFLKSNGVE